MVWLQEQKLTGKSAQARSTIDSFASKAGNEVYASIAATAMARARARLLGFDSGTSAVAAVLDALLALDGGRGERAMALDEACTAPGIVIPAQASPFSESATQANNAAAANPTRPDASGIQNRSARTSAPDPLADRTRSLGAYGRRSQASSQRSATGAPPAAQQARAVTNPKVGWGIKQPTQTRITYPLHCRSTINLIITMITRCPMPFCRGQIAFSLTVPQKDPS